MPLDTWRRTASSMSVLPGDFMQGLKPEGVTRVADRFLSVPGVGYTREWQEQVQEWFRLGGEYQTALQNYMNAFGRVAIDSLEHLKKKIVELAEQGRDLTTLREIYDLWVDSSEGAYAQFVVTDEYAELYGRLVNALMALKHHGRSMVDEGLAAMNMPTRKGFDTMQSRQQDLRRELKTVRAELDDLKATLQGDGRVIRQWPGVRAPRTQATKTTGTVKAKPTSRRNRRRDKGTRSTS
ncbi:MAG: class III poly(R)-hydroxyalkanoic acid synthase subunit PhaE, partial [Gammaproteobacteria bacterium]|nr:class III poly(R)-hydroxyalkanoic acid synthase subunit PhaE [Gammaproteobacteria bacterium]